MKLKLRSIHDMELNSKIQNEETKQVFYTYDTGFWKADKLFTTLFP